MESNKIITLIGYGRLGSCLASQLIKSRAGLKYIVSPEVSNKGKFRNKLTKEIVSESDVIIICVQDKNIGTVVRNISDLKVSLNGKIIFHTSGIQTSDELKSLKGAYIGSFHPAQTFTKKSTHRNLFEGIYIALEGTEKFLSYAEKLTVKLGAKYFVIKKDKKIVYHLLCVLVSNYMLTYFSFMENLAVKSDLPENWFEILNPLLQETLTNIKGKNIYKSLTGPITRFDLDTIEKHIKSIKQNKSLYQLYKIFGSEASEIALKNGDISKQQYKELKNIFK